MKKILATLSLIFLFIFIFTPTSKAYTSHPLDEIESYEIWVNTRDDGTLDIEYQIKWLVLDSSEEGVTWVKIGVPNRYCNEVKKISSDVKKAYYTGIEGGSYVRCELGKEFMQGEIIDIHFSVHQNRMFTVGYDGDTKLATFKLIPGWFNEIEVKKLTINWNKDNTYYYFGKRGSKDYSLEDNGNYLSVTYLDLAQGEKVEADVSYDITVFPNIDESKTYVGPGDHRSMYAMMIVVAVFILIIIIVYSFATASRRRSYYCARGFYPVGRRYFFRPYYYGITREGTRTVNPYTSHSSSHGGGGHSCACACACACAGGGRAGCSKKDFYKGKIDINKFIDENK